MGKKGKTLKIKQYKVPQEKFLVVINPWGIYGNFDVADFNHIGAWFAKMLEEEHPTTRIRAIYYQRTHRNIIVELPKEVDVELYLGAHHYSKFLNAAQSDKVAYIYEYKYSNFGNPTKSLTFAINHAMYDHIPPNFPIKSPYPLPSPAPSPPTDVSYARPIPPEVNERIADRLRNPTLARVRPPSPGPSPSMSPMKSHSPASHTMLRQVGSRMPENGKGTATEFPLPTSTENNFIPYVRPGYLNPTLTDRLKRMEPSEHHTKMDPYDREEQDRSSLLKGSGDKDDAQVFLVSIINGIKVEEPPEAETIYKPSSELLDALSSLPDDLIEPNIRVKAEETEESQLLKPTNESCNPSYQPSDDLLVALATLPDMDLSGEMECLMKSNSTPHKRRIQCGTGPESPKRIKREE